MLVAQRTLAHVRQFDSTLRTCVHEPIATLGMEFGGSDDLGQLLHIRWLDIDDIEALILNVEIPQVNPEVITADKRLAITINRDAVDVIGVGISIRASRDCSYNGIVVRQAWKLEIASVLEM